MSTIIELIKSKKILGASVTLDPIGVIRDVPIAAIRHTEKFSWSDGASVTLDPIGVIRDVSIAAIRRTEKIFLE